VENKPPIPYYNRIKGAEVDKRPDVPEIIYFSYMGSKATAEYKQAQEKTATEFRLLGVIEDILLEIQILQKRQNATYKLLEKLFKK
jgi:hypothetical protein